jgi:predicted site-specific integrase-resolvase
MIDYTQVRFWNGSAMLTAVNGKTYYSAQETAAAAGISKPTLLRWIKTKRIKDSEKRDRNGWRLFAEPEVEAIRKLAQTAK